MLNLLQFDLNQYLLFFFILIRVSGIFLTAPILSANNVPVRLRVAMSLLISLIFFSVVPSNFQVLNWNVIDYFLVCAKELIIGLLLGIVPRVMFAAIDLAGNVVGFLMGFAIVNVVDPQTETQVSIIASFKTMLATLLFVVIDGHHIFINSISKSYELIPIEEYQYRTEQLDFLVRITGDLFITGFQLGAPLIIALFLANIIMGFMARSIPQMNIFIVGFPFTIGLGLILLAFSMPYIIQGMIHLFMKLDQQMIDFLNIMQ